MANISVIVPTYQSRNLEPTIAALRDQRGVSLQVIVVENGSNTLAAQNWFADAVRAGDVRHEILETPNLNRARNAGVGLASAPVIAFTDDDCVPSRVWAQSLAQTFYDHPAAGIVAGKVRLQFIATPPHWVRGPFLNYLSRLDLGRHCREIEKNEWITGANFAVRRDVFDRVGIFDEGIGMMGRDPALAGNDEMEFKRRVRSTTDYQVVYQPRALVHHVISGDRLTQEYFESRRYGQGRADFILDRAHGRLRTNDAAYRNLRRRLEQAYAYFSVGGPGDEPWRDCHRSNYFRCLIAYACGFHHAVIKHIDHGGVESGRDYHRCWESAGFFRANDSDHALLMMEMRATLLSLVRGGWSAPAREQWVRRCLDCLDGLGFRRIPGRIVGRG